MSGFDNPVAMPIDSALTEARDWQWRAIPYGAWRSINCAVNPPLIMPDAEWAPLPAIEPGAVAYIETVGQRKIRERRWARRLYMRAWRARKKAER